jgi:phage-related tail fiber protein
MYDIGDRVSLRMTAAAFNGKEDKSYKDHFDGYVGLSDYKINFLNIDGTIISLFQNNNTAERLYTFQNRNGIIADLADIALKADINSPTFTGVPAGPTAAPSTNTTQFATTAYVMAQIAVSFVSPTFTGIPKAPTATLGDNTTQIATTAFVLANGVPTGTVIDFAATTPPLGFLKANGAAISRTTYSALFAAIGTTFGAGDGTTTFNIPDLRGEFRRGWDDARGVDAGRVFGSFQDHQSNNVAEFSTHLIGAVSTGAAAVPDDGNWSAYRGSGRDSGTISFRMRHHGRETRPRNRAFLTCIKY